MIRGPLQLKATPLSLVDSNMGPISQELSTFSVYFLPMYSYSCHYPWLDHLTAPLLPHMMRSFQELSHYVTMISFQSIHLHGRFTHKPCIAISTYFVPQQVNMSITVLFLLPQPTHRHHKTHRKLFDFMKNPSICSTRTSCDMGTWKLKIRRNKNQIKAKTVLMPLLDYRVIFFDIF